MEIIKVPIEQIEPWEKNPRGIIKKCSFCNKEFKVFLSQIRNNRGKYCSKKCYSLWLKENFNGYWLGKKRSIDTIQKMKLRMKGRHVSLETEFKKGHISWMKGRGMSMEEKKEARKKAINKFNNKPERKLYMKDYDIRYGRYSIDENFWKWLCEMLDYRCQYCGHQFPARKLEIDHIIPISKGGTSQWNNIQPFCHSCNCRKKNHEFVISNAMERAQRLYQGNA